MILFSPAKSKKKVVACSVLFALLFATVPLSNVLAVEPEITVTTETPTPVIEGINGESTEDGTVTPTATTTGGEAESNISTTTIVTGDAVAEAFSSTTINSFDYKSEFSATATPDQLIDFDDYSFSATGTNDGTVDTEASSSAITGDNIASSTEGAAHIETGDAVAVVNIANVINTNVVNSHGFMLLLNQLLEGQNTFDLRNLFFPSFQEYAVANSTPSCDLVTCYASDIVYTVENTNNADITNDAIIEAVSGQNGAFGNYGGIDTGDAYAGANVLNVANTNIVDSNYILVAVNGMGSLNGDLVLPNGDFFSQFFASQTA
jgi:hypothetical protein